MTPAEMLLSELREAALEDAKCGWYDPAPRYTSRAMLLERAADRIEEMREALERVVAIRDWNHDEAGSARREYDNAAEQCCAALTKEA